MLHVPDCRGKNSIELSRVSSVKAFKNEKNFYLMNIGSNIVNLGKPPIPVEVMDGPIFTEIRQDFSSNAALVTRVFKSSNRILRSSLQQFVLLDKIEMSQEFLLHVSTGFSDSTLLLDEGGVSAKEVSASHTSSNRILRRNAQNSPIQSANLSFRKARFPIILYE